MSDTPETDASCGYALSSHYGRLEGSYLQMDWSGPFVHAEVARKLERERDQLKQLLAADSERVDAYLGVCIERDEAREKYDKLATEHMLVVNKLCEERDEAREEIEALRHEYHGAKAMAGGFKDKIKSLREQRDEAREKAERYRIEANAMMMQRDEAREELEEYRSIAENIGSKKAVSEKEKAIKERDEWKNKAYSHATDYTLMEAKCFRLEQQLKEYDQLKS